MTAHAKVVSIYGPQTLTVDNLDDFDRALDRIHAAGTPTWVQLVVNEDEYDDPSEEAVVLDIGLGAPYSTLRLYDVPSGRYDSVGTLPAPASDDEFAMGGTPTPMGPDSAIPVERAREAAREFAATGRRPQTIEWRVAQG